MTDKPVAPHLTHATGAPVSDNLNIQTAGPRGPALFQDGWLMEKLAHFSREQQQILFDNTARSVDGAAVQIQQRHVGNRTKADPAYGAGVTEALGRLLSVGS